MRKRFLSLLSCLCILFSCFAAAPVAGAALEATSIELNTDNKTLTLGDTYTLTATLSPPAADDVNVRWRSSDSNVVTVTTESSNGEIETTGGAANATITAKGVGTATITVSILGISTDIHASCTVTVKEAEVEIPPEKIVIRDSKGNTYTSDSFYTIYKDEFSTSGNFNLNTVFTNIIIYGKDNTLATNQGYTWSIKSNNNKLSVTDDGLLALQSSASLPYEGTVTVTADKESTGEKAVTESFTLYVKERTVITPESTSLTLIANQDPVELTASITPSLTVSNGEVKWTSSDKSVVTVEEENKSSDDEKISTTVTAKNVTSKKTATVTATFTEGSQTTQCTWTITVLPVPTDIKIEVEKTVEVGSSIVFYADITPSDALGDGMTLNDIIDWNVKSADGEGQADISKNDMLLTGKAAGTVTLTATANGGEVSDSVTITVVQPVENIKLVSGNKTIDTYTAVITSKSLEDGDPTPSEPIFTLEAVVEPTTSSDTTVTWGTSNASVATFKVSESDPSIVTVTCHDSGTATITATSLNGKSASCVVTVTKPVQDVKINPVEQNDETVGDGENNRYKLYAGSHLSLSAQVYPTGAASVQWTSSNTTRATVSASGYVTARTPGTVEITATASGTDKTAVFYVEVVAVDAKSITLNPSKTTKALGSSFDIKATIVPSNATNQEITWSITSKTEGETVEGISVAGRGSNLGRVTISTLPSTNVKKTFIVKATVTNSDGTSAEGECELTISEVAATGITLNPADPFTLEPNASQNVVAKLSPTGAVETVDWSVDGQDNDLNGSIITGKSSEDSLTVSLTAQSPGVVTLKGAVSSGVSASVKITVSGILLDTEGQLNSNGQLSMSVGDSKTLGKLLYGTAAALDSTDWEWTSSDSSKVRVTPSSGLITAVALTDDPVTITCKQGNYSATVQVVVTADGGSSLSRTMTGSVYKFSSVSASIANQCDSAGETLSYATSFSVSPSQGTLYYGYVSVNNPGSGVATGDKFYRDDTSSHLQLNQITFVPASSFVGVAEITYTLVCVSGNTINCTLKLTVPAPSSINYTSDTGEAIPFRAEDFNTYCKNVYGVNLSTVRFNPPDSRYGYLVYDYSGGEVYGGNVTSDKSYYVSSNPSISKVYFVPKDSYAGTFTLTYSGVDTAGNTFTGKVSITVIQAEEVSSGDVAYEIINGERRYVTLNDFALFCAEAASGTLNYVTFNSLPDSGKGTLYLGSSTPVAVGEWYYYTSTGHADSFLGDVNILPADGFTGSFVVPFTVYSTNGESAPGLMAVTCVKKDGQANTITYTSTGLPVGFRRADFVSACKSALPGTLASVEFYTPSASDGKLYESFKDLSDCKILSPETSVSAGNLLSVTFVPKGNKEGAAYLNYIASDGDGNTCTGSIQVFITHETASSCFNDVKGAYSWEAASIDFLQRYGVVVGVTETSYDPGASMNRGGFTLMISRAYDFPKVGLESFPDVPTDKYYAWAVAAAKAKGVVVGSSNGNFNPEDYLTRQDAAVLLYRALQADGQYCSGNLDDLYVYPDYMEIADYAQEAMAAMVQLGIYQGDAHGNLNPSGILSRGEMAVILHRALT